MAIFGRLDDEARDRRDRVAQATDTDAEDGAEHHDEVAVARDRDRARDAQDAARARDDEPRAG